MAEYTALAPLFTDIANAIRSKTGETGAITANLFPERINSIQIQNLGVLNTLNLINGTLVLTNNNSNELNYSNDMKHIIFCVYCYYNGKYYNWTNFIETKNRNSYSSPYFTYGRYQICFTCMVHASTIAFFAGRNSGGSQVSVSRCAGIGFLF